MAKMFTLENKRLGFIIAACLFILLLPLVAMLFTQEVNWSLADFLVAAFLLLGTGLAIEFTLRKVRKTSHRLLLVLGILLLLLLVWAELAVGIFGTAIAGS